jgi:hypothetical protein
MLARIGEPVELARSILLIAIRVDYSSRTEWMNGNVVLFYRDHIDHHGRHDPPQCLVLLLLL